MNKAKFFERVIIDNLKYKISYLANKTNEMAVIETDEFVKVDCGLPADTFNIITLLKQPSNNRLSSELLQAIDDFRLKNFPMSLWCWDNQIDDFSHQLKSIGLVEAEINIAMAADLDSLAPKMILPEGFRIKAVSSPSEIIQFGEMLSSLFDPSIEADSVQKYYHKVSSLLLANDPNMKLYIGTFQDKIVGIGSLVFTADSTGIYDIATREERRGKGLGSAMFHYLLLEAKTRNTKLCVLQASPDGINIYKRAGFQPVGQLKVFENIDI